VGREEDQWIRESGRGGGKGEEDKKKWKMENKEKGKRKIEKMDNLNILPSQSNR
jgi:hypothetical protein